MLEEILDILYRPVYQRIAATQNTLTQQIGVLMASAEEIRDQLSAAITDVKTSLTAALARVEADVEELQRQVTSASDVDPTLFDGVKQSLADVKSSLDSLDPLADFPAPEPPAEPTP